MFCHLLGNLVQLNDGLVCPGDSRTVFQCSGNFISWMVALRDRSQSYPLALTRFDPVGHRESGTLNSSMIIFEVTFNNGSFITSTLTFMIPVNLNGSTIICDEMMMELTVISGFSGKKFLSPFFHAYQCIPEC